MSIKLHIYQFCNLGNTRGSPVKEIEGFPWIEFYQNLSIIQTYSFQKVLEQSRIIRLKFDLIFVEILVGILLPSFCQDGPFSTIMKHWALWWFWATWLAEINLCCWPMINQRYWNYNLNNSPKCKTMAILYEIVNCLWNNYFLYALLLFEEWWISIFLGIPICLNTTPGFYVLK